MTNTREINYICTPYFCRRSVLTFYQAGKFPDTPIMIPAEHFDFFAVVLKGVIDSYTMFDDRIIDTPIWNEFLFTSSEYLSCESYDELLEMASEQLADWLKINGEIFCLAIEKYRSTLASLIEWTAENVSDKGIMVKGV